MAAEFSISALAAGLAGQAGRFSPPALAFLLLCLLPTSFLCLLPALRYAGRRRLGRAKVLARSAKAIETAGRIQVLLLEEEGAVTNRDPAAVAFFPAPGLREEELAAAAAIASLGDGSPEGRSIRALAEEVCGGLGARAEELDCEALAPEASTGLGGATFPDGTPPLRIGPAVAIEAWLRSRGGELPPSVGAAAAYVVERGGLPLLVALGDKALGVVQLKFLVREGLRERLFRLKRLGIRTVLLSPRPPRLAEAIAAEAGAEDFEPESGPGTALARVRTEVKAGRVLAFMSGKAEEAPALAAASLGLAPAAGSPEAAEACGLRSLDEDPTKLLEVAEIGRELRSTKSLLATMALASDLARVLILLPALLAALSPSGGPALRSVADLLGFLASRSLLLSALICSALAFLLLLFLAFRGLAFRPAGSATPLGRSRLAYGLIGLASPFLGAKILDHLLRALGAS